MSRILITGCSGFIGSALLPRLQDDHTVYCLRSNLLDYDKVVKEVTDYAPDIIIHLAARTEVEKSFYDQTGFSEVNYVGSVNLIEAAAKVRGFKNFLFASTMEVYGWQPISDDIVADRQFLPVAFDERTPTYPNAPYAVAKLAVERYLEYMYRSRDFPFVALRQTNSYGRKDNNFFVTEQIIFQMLTNPEEIFLGYQKPFRNFLYIDDLIEAWVALITHSHDLCKGEVLTLGPDAPVQISNWARRIADHLGWQGQIHWDSKPKRPGEIYWLNSNYDRMQALTGWQPLIEYDEGLLRTINTWKKQVETVHTT